MTLQEDYICCKFGIDEIYIHEGLSLSLLEKLSQRAVLCMNGEDPIVKKYASHDMVLIFRHIPNQSLIYRFLKFLDQDSNKEEFIECNTLLNEEELFLPIKSKNFVLITPKVI